MHPVQLNAFVEELEKIALNRAERADPAYARMNPFQLHAHRDAAWGAGQELGDHSLALRRDFQVPGAATELKQVGGIPVHPQSLGPVTYQGVPMVGPESGSFIRNHFGAPDNVVEGRSVDNTLQRAVVSHEAGESAQFHAAMSLPGKNPDSISSRVRRSLYGGGVGEANAVPAGPVGSHLGVLPNLEEQMSSFRDPAAAKIMWNGRLKDPDNRFIVEKMRQFGARPGDSPLPIGGRQHAALERLNAERMPSEGMAVQNRVMMMGDGAAYGAKDPSKTVSNVIGNLEDVRGMLPPVTADSSLGQRAKNWIANKSLDLGQTVARRAGKAFQQAPAQVPEDVGRRLLTARAAIRMPREQPTLAQRALPISQRVKEIVQRFRR